MFSGPAFDGAIVRRRGAAADFRAARGGGWRVLPGAGAHLWCCCASLRSPLVRARGAAAS